MKTYRSFLLVVFLVFGVVAPIATTGCGTPTTRNATVATLLSVGHTAEAAVSLSAQLYADKKITEAQAWAVFSFYNDKFQPAFRVARSAARFDGQAAAPIEVVNLANDLASLVASYRK